MSAGFEFSLTTKDTTTDARLGRITTPRGSIVTPTFMPVGTQGTVKGLTIDQVQSTGAQQDHPRQHVPFGSTTYPANAYNDSAACISSWLARTNPHRQRRFSNLSASPAHQDNRTWRKVPFPVDGSLLELTPEESISHSRAARAVILRWCSTT